MRPAPAPAVLDRLVGQPVGRAAGVPGADGAAQTASPAAELLDVAGEGEQVRPGAGDLGQRGEGGLAGLGHRGGVGQGEQGRVLARRRAAGRDPHDRVDQGARVVGGHAPEDLGIVDGQVLGARVVGAAVHAQDEEPAQARGVIEGEDVAAGGVRHLVGGGPPTLRREPGADGAQDVHNLPLPDDPPTRTAGAKQRSVRPAPRGRSRTGVCADAGSGRVCASGSSEEGRESNPAVPVDNRRASGPPAASEQVPACAGTKECRPLHTCRARCPAERRSGTLGGQAGRLDQPARPRGAREGGRGRAQAVVCSDDRVSRSAIELPAQCRRGLEPRTG